MEKLVKQNIVCSPLTACSNTVNTMKYTVGKKYVACEGSTSICSNLHLFLNSLLFAFAVRCGFFFS